MDFTTVTPMLYAELNATGSLDLVFWSEDELYRYADRRLNDLSRKLRLFVDVQDSLVLPAAQGAYDFAHTTDDTPADTRFCSLIHLALNGASLAPASVAEVEALDANWQTATPANPQCWIGDNLSTAIAGIYPSPSAQGTLVAIAQRTPPELTAATSILDAPDALADLLHMRTLAEARRKRSDAWMPEAAEIADQIAGILEQAFTVYYGAAL